MAEDGAECGNCATVNIVVTCANTTPSLIFLPDRVNELNSLDENAMMIPSSNLFCLKVVPQFVCKNIRSLNYL